MIRQPEAPGGVPASIAALMASIRQEVLATPAKSAGADHPEEVPSGVHPIPGVPTTDGRLEEVPGGVHPISGVPTAAPGLPPGIDTTVRALLQPMLRDWLDAHLPEIVEAAVQAEIRRLTGQA